MERPTFSPFWHRVRAMRPRLRAHVEITRQHYRGRRWHVAHDPGSNQFYRLSPVAHEFVGMLDGVRTVEEAWKIALAKFGDAAPTQNEVVELLSQLHSTNLLALDTTPETEQLLERGRERVKRRLMQQAIGIMYFRIRVFSPDRLLTVVEPILRPVLNRWGLVAWAVVVGWTVLSLVPVWPRLAKGFDDYFLSLAMSNPSEWAWMLAVFVGTKLIHEFGHGVVCKRLGGQVPECGVMLLVLIPSPYVDASSCWAFPSKWQRTAVGAAGMLFELFVAAVAAQVWLNAVEGTLAHRMAYYTMVSASIATLVFNANPLMRFDGYYMLSDLLEVPNLMPRSQQMIHAVIQKYVFRLRNVRFPSSQGSERAILLVYGIASGIYRVFLFVVITLYVLGQFFIIGVILAAWTSAVWFITPVGKLVHWLATSTAIGEHRGRTIGATLGLAALLAVVVGVIPFPDWRRAQGVVESPRHSGVYFETDGFVVEALARPGQRVRRGEVLARLESPDLVRARRTMAAQIRDAEVRLAAARAQDKPGEVAVVENQAAGYRRQLEEIERRIAGLEVRSPHDGCVVAADPQLVVGAYVTRGDGLCQVVDDRSLRVTATLAQGEGAWFNELSREQYEVEMRFASDIPRVVEGGRVWSPAAALVALPHPALGIGGGGTIETDPRDADGRVAKRGVFNVHVEPVSAGPLGTPGERVWLRFSLPAKPIVAQIIDRLQKTLQGKVNL